MFFLGMLVFPLETVFASPSLIITDNDITLEKQDPLVGQTVRIYAKIANRGGDDSRGIVKFFDGTSKQIGTDQPFSVLKGKTADVFTDYQNLPYGDRTIVVKVIPWQSPSDTVVAKKGFFVDRDNDQDGIPDRRDPDDDNDGVCDQPPAVEGVCHLNPDGSQDAFPLDQKEWIDTDHDGIGNNRDTDDDNDGWTDVEEQKLGTDPLKWDTDGDGKNDKEDAFPLDASEWNDSDHDGIGDNKEVDDDNDGVCDQPPAIDGVCHLNPDGSGDAFPKDPTEWMDTDHDGIGDNRDMDDDNDGLSDGQEKDKGTDPKNPDTDGDGYTDASDVFPLDRKEWMDTDHDGLGDNEDPDNHNKGPVLLYDIPREITLILPYHFDASQTYDPDGQITNITWVMDGMKKEGSSFWYLFFTPGKHTLVLKAVDDKGEGRTKVFELSVSGLLYIWLMVLLIVLFLIHRFWLSLSRTRFTHHTISPLISSGRKKKK